VGEALEYQYFATEQQQHFIIVVEFFCDGRRVSKGTGQQGRCTCNNNRIRLLIFLFKIPVSGNPLQSSNPIEEYIKLIVQKGYQSKFPNEFQNLYS
jgi:hypothetical protein